MIVRKISSLSIGKNDGPKEIADAIAYIKDPFKVFNGQFKVEQIDLLSDQDMAENFIRNISLDTENNLQVTYFGTYRCKEDEFKVKCQQLKQLYLCYQRKKADNGPFAYHVVLSWPHNASVSDEEVYHIGCKFLQKLGNYPAILGAHIEPVMDKNLKLLRGTQKHCHMLICAYPDTFDAVPRKLNFGYKNQKLHEISDALAIEYGHSIIVNADFDRSHSYYAASKSKIGESWVYSLREKAQAAFNATDNLYDYASILKEAGYTIKLWRGDLLYCTSDHKITARKLGWEFTLDGLITRRADRQRTVKDDALSKTQKMHGSLYADIPLGGHLFPNRACKRFPLTSDVAYNYSNEVLESYFVPEVQYRISDENQEFLLNANGRQILDFLDIEEKNVDLRENFIKKVRFAAETCQELNPDQFKVVQDFLCNFYKREIVFEYVNRIDAITEAENAEIRERLQNELKSQIEKEKKRIEHELRRTCEEQTQIIELKHMYLCQSQRRDEYRAQQQRKSKRVKKYDWSRDPNGNFRSGAEKFLLLICLLCIPNFNLDKYSYFVEDQKDLYGPMNWEIQRQVDFMRTMREEGFATVAELETATKEAAKAYGKTKRKLAEMNAKMALNEYLYYSIETYLDVVPKIHELIKSGMDLESLKKERGDLVSRYEDSVRHIRTYTANSWQSLDDIIREYKEIQELRPVLLQTVAAQYEHYRRLALANETAVLNEYSNLLKSERFNNYIRSKNSDAFTKHKKTVSSSKISSTPPNPQQNTDTSVLQNTPTPSSELIYDVYDEPNSLKNTEQPVSQSKNEDAAQWPDFEAMIGKAESRANLNKTKEKSQKDLEKEL